jgi:beta-galactosidase
VKKIILIGLVVLGVISFHASGLAATFTPPATPRGVYNFNANWKFIREDVTNAETVAFDDSQWTTVSAPHTYNDVDSYADFISHSSGDRRAYSGVAWYRKHFKLPAGASSGKVGSG